MDCATSEFQVGPLQSRVALAGAFAGFEGRVNGHKPLRPPTWSVARGPTLEDRDRLIVNKLAYQLDEPHIGDVVMLYYPNDPSKALVKRVIADAGDQVRIVDGRVYRNDVLLDDTFVPPDFRSHEDWGPQVVPEGYKFVLGDHRSNSSDSRIWGFVPKKYIIGKVQLRWWPLSHARTF